MSEPKETYLGDGLYASHDGYQIILRAPRGMTEAHDHFVALEPAVYRSLVEFAANYAGFDRRRALLADGQEGEAE